MQFPANAKNTCHIHLPCPSNKNTSLQVVISRGFLNLHSRNVQLIQFYRVLVYALGKGMCTMCLSNLQITRENTSHSSRLPFTHTEFTHQAMGYGRGDIPIPRKFKRFYTQCDDISYETHSCNLVLANSFSFQVRQVFARHHTH